MQQREAGNRIHAACFRLNALFNLVFCKNTLEKTWWSPLFSNIKMIFIYFHSGQFSNSKKKISNILRLNWFYISCHIGCCILCFCLTLELVVILDARSVSLTQWNEKWTSLDARQLSLAFFLSLSLSQAFFSRSLGILLQRTGDHKEGTFSRTNAVSSRLQTLSLSNVQCDIELRYIREIWRCVECICAL